MLRSMKYVFVQALFTSTVLGRSVPQNIRDFYNAVKPGKCTGSDLLQGGFHDTDGSDAGGMFEFLGLQSSHGNRGRSTAFFSK